MIVMAADSDGDLIETVVTCEGNLGDPEFPNKFRTIVDRLKYLLSKEKGESLKVNKVEPWNSVKVTFSIPREAALRLRELANEGSSTLTQLGILSVQVEGDEAISLRIASRFGGEAQEIVLHSGSSQDSNKSRGDTSSNGASPNDSSDASTSMPGPSNACNISTAIRDVTQLLGAESTSEKAPQFRSPNVVAPTDCDPIPAFLTKSVTPSSSGSNVGNQSSSINPNASPRNNYNGPFPFASMTHAAQAIHNRESQVASNIKTTQFKHHTQPPPPYPAQETLATNHTLTTGHTTTQPTLPLNPVVNQYKPNIPSASSASNSAPGCSNGNQVALSSPLLVNLLQNDGAAHPNNVLPGQKIQSPGVVEGVGINRMKPTKKPTVRRKEMQSTASESPPNLDSLRSEDLIGGTTGAISGRVQSSGPSAFATVNVNQPSTLPQQSVSLQTAPTSHQTVGTVVSQSQTLYTQVQMQQKFSARHELSYRPNQIAVHSQMTVRHPVNGQQMRTPLQQRQQLILQQQILAQQQSIVNNAQSLQQQTVAVSQPLQHQTVVPPLQSVPMSNSPMIQPQQQQQIIQQQSTAGLNVVQQRLNYLNNNPRQQTPPPYPRQTATATTTTAAQQPPQHHLNQQQSQTLNVQQQLHHNQLKNMNVNTSATNDFRYGQSQNMLSRNFANTTTSANGTTWNPQNNSIPQGAQVNSTQHTQQRLVTVTSQQSQQQPPGAFPQSVVRTNHVATASSVTPTTANPSTNDQESSSESTTANEVVNEPEPEYTSTGKIRQFLINPLTGHLEPMPSESSDSEPESAVDNQDDFFSFPSPSNDRSNSIFSDDDADSNISRRNDTTTNTDQSDSETTGKSTGSEGSLKHSRIKSARDSPMPGEKIKLRLKLEKSEPITPAYKVDVSFVNTPPVRKADKSLTKMLTGAPPNSAIGGDEPRVPPLHISLRGRSASVVPNPKKDKKLVREDGDFIASKRRGKFKKMKETTDGNKLLQKKSLNMLIASSSSAKLPLTNSTVVNSVSAVQKINNSLQNLVNKPNILKQESLIDASRLPVSGTNPSSSKSGDVDDIPLNSRIPSPLKPKSIVNQTPNPQQVLNKSQVETEVQNHTNEHKIGGGKTKRRDSKKKADTGEGQLREQNLLSGGRILDNQAKWRKQGSNIPKGEPVQPLKRSESNPNEASTLKRVGEVRRTSDSDIGRPVVDKGNALAAVPSRMVEVNGIRKDLLNQEKRRRLSLIDEKDFHSSESQNAEATHKVPEVVHSVSGVSKFTSNSSFDNDSPLAKSSSPSVAQHPTQSTVKHEVKTLVQHDGTTKSVLLNKMIPAKSKVELEIKANTMTVKAHNVLQKVKNHTLVKNDSLAVNKHKIDHLSHKKLMQNNVLKCVERVTVTTKLEQISLLKTPLKPTICTVEQITRPSNVASPPSKQIQQQQQPQQQQQQNLIETTVLVVEREKPKPKLPDNTVMALGIIDTSAERVGGNSGGNTGEDSGIESMDALSEKSPNQGESPLHRPVTESAVAQSSVGSKNLTQGELPPTIDKNVPSSTNSSDMCSNAELLKSSDPKTLSPESVASYLDAQLKKATNLVESVDTNVHGSSDEPSLTASKTLSDHHDDRLAVANVLENDDKVSVTNPLTTAAPTVTTALLTKSDICDSKLLQYAKEQITEPSKQENSLESPVETCKKVDINVKRQVPDVEKAHEGDPAKTVSSNVSSDEKKTEVVDKSVPDDSHKNNNVIADQLDVKNVIPKTSSPDPPMQIIKTKCESVKEQCNSDVKLEVKTEVEPDDTRQLESSVTPPNKSEVSVKVELTSEKKPQAQVQRDGVKKEATVAVKVEELPKKTSTPISELTEVTSVPSPLGDDPQPIRITPPLYTYSNPVVLQRDDTPSPAAQNIEPESSDMEHIKKKRRRKQELEGRHDVICIEENDESHFVERLNPMNSEECVKRSSKSLLEQLLIEIPNENTEKRSLRTRSQRLNSPDIAKTPKSSPHGIAATAGRGEERRSISPYAKASPKLGLPKLSPNPGAGLKAGKRKRQESESSVASSTAEETQPRPGKRKCSENAAELIKVCMGVDESGPIKKQIHGKDEQKKSYNILAKAKKGPILVDVESSDEESLTDLGAKGKIRQTDEITTQKLKESKSSLNTSVAGSQLNSTNVANFNASNRVQRESRLLTTKQPGNANSLPVGKERLRGTSVSSNESVGEVTTRRSVRQSAVSPLATPASNTRGASRSMEDVNRRKTRSGAGRKITVEPR